MHPRAVALATLAIPLLAAGCGASTAGPARATRLTVAVHGINGSEPWQTTWTLRCSPAGGTHPDPAAACSALADLLAHHTIPTPNCPHAPSAPWTTVRGVYRGRRISLKYAEACASSDRASLEAQALGAYFAHG